MIYRIANNLICQGSNVVVISHLKQFIGCSFTIIHEGHACFMNNQSNSNTSRLDNEELLRGMRPIQAQRWSRTNTVLYVLPWALHRSHCESVFLSLCACVRAPSAVTVRETESIYMSPLFKNMQYLHLWNLSTLYLSGRRRRWVSQLNSSWITE